jgi:hypothetical protein
MSALINAGPSSSSRGEYRTGGPARREILEAPALCVWVPFFGEGVQGMKTFCFLGRTGAAGCLPLFVGLLPSGWDGFGPSELPVLPS